VLPSFHAALISVFLYSYLKQSFYRLAACFLVIRESVKIYLIFLSALVTFAVAPHAGAWIEIHIISIRKEK
jgi:hypothetical protein